MYKGNMNRGTAAVIKEEDDFGNQEEWGQEEFEEHVSVRSSRYGGSSVYVPAGGQDQAMRNSGNFGYSENKGQNPQEKKTYQYQQEMD